MATESSFTYSPVRVATVSNGAYARRLDVPLKKDCGTPSPGAFESPSDFWNCNRCGNDKIFATPVYDNDPLYFQLHYPDPNPQGAYTKGWYDGVNDWFVQADIVTLSGDPNSPTITQQFNTHPNGFYYVGRNKDGVAYQNIIINNHWDAPGLYPVMQCFYVRFTYKDESGNLTYTYSGAYEYIPFPDNDCRKTIVLEGGYGTRDFEGDIYELADTDNNNFFGNSNFIHRAMRRFFGTYEKTDYSISKDLNDNGLVTKSKRDEIYSFLLNLIPPYEAVILDKILSGTSFGVNDSATFAALLEFTINTGFSKNNEDSHMWLPRFTATVKFGEGTQNPTEVCK